MIGFFHLLKIRIAPFEPFVSIPPDPYRRIVVTHLVLGASVIPVTIAAQTYPKVAIVLIVLKIYFDQKSTTTQNFVQSIDSKKI